MVNKLLVVSLGLQGIVLFYAHKKILNQQHILYFVTLLISIIITYKSLNDTKKTHLKITPDIQNMINQLKDVNIKLWSIEDEKRICEKNKDFSKKFIELSRNVYINNDKRSKIKSEINVPNVDIPLPAIPFKF